MKMKLLTAFKLWMVIYPSMLVFQFFLGDHLSSLPVYLRSLLLTVTIIPWVVFIAMPLLNRIIRKLK